MCIGMKNCKGVLRLLYVTISLQGSNLRVPFSCVSIYKCGFIQRNDIFKSPLVHFLVLMRMLDFDVCLVTASRLHDAC
jgi:hypothetical protein